MEVVHLEVPAISKDAGAFNTGLECPGPLVQGHEVDLGGVLVHFVRLEQDRQSITREIRSPVPAIRFRRYVDCLLGDPLPPGTPPVYDKVVPAGITRHEAVAICGFNEDRVQEGVLVQGFLCLGE